MPFYSKIDRETKEGKRTVEGLFRLKKQLKKEIPVRNLNDSILLGTWNIREFDSPAYGERKEESIMYIAEIISHFDIVAIQEVRANLKALEKLKYRLGSNWNFIVSDVTSGRKGNKERMAFLFDTRKISFGGLAGELVLPPIKDKEVSQIARTPFMCGFNAGWIKFVLATVHIIYGKNKKDNPERIKEIEEVAKAIKDKAKDKNSWSKNFVLLGDFNIYSPKDKTMEALQKNKFIIPEALQKLPSNTIKNKHYDQIAFPSNSDLQRTNKSGVFDFFKSVYRLEDEKEYIKEMGKSYNVTSKGKTRTQKSKKKLL